jgi:hypothetical protein
MRRASDLTLARRPVSVLTPEERRRVFSDYARPELGRRTHIIRELPVRLLTVTECRRLMVHNHGKPIPGRAYWKKINEARNSGFSIE